MYGSAVLTLKSGSFLQVWVSLLHCCWLLLGLLALLSSNRAVQASLFSSFSMGLNSFTPWWWRMSHLSSRGLRGPFCLQRNLWARRQRLFCFPFSAFWWHKRRSNYVSELEFWENCNILWDIKIHFWPLCKGRRLFHKRYKWAWGILQAIYVCHN